MMSNLMSSPAGEVFSANFGAVKGWDDWEGLPPRRYEFRIIQVQSGQFTGGEDDAMVRGCAEFDMKPVCDSWTTCGPWEDGSLGHTHAHQRMRIHICAHICMHAHMLQDC